MHILKKTLGFLLLLLLVLFTSFTNREKSHLIVGNWVVTTKQKIQFKNNKDFHLNQIFFGSDEFTADFNFISKDKEEKEVTLAYKIHENKAGFKKPLIIFKNVCDYSYSIAFTIETLTKNDLELKLHNPYTSKEIMPNVSFIKLERNAGPPENME